MTEEKEKSLNFIEQIIEEDIAEGKHGGRIHTRFPPEPNGYLHLGHAQAICLNFNIAKKYGGLTNLRFDDTNPSAEDQEYVDAIKNDIRWLGFDWGDREYYTSDYFEQLYEMAEELIQQGLAYVDESTQEEINEMKGKPDQPGVLSPYRDRPIEESLQLFRQMRAGEIEEGKMVLRAKIDMASPNMHMRDPIMYRIKFEHHQRSGDAWVIYPMYDFAHGQSDSIESITHSLCSLEFKHHRPLYDWFIEKLGIFPSRQIEFARRNVSYMITSKRKLSKLIEKGIVSGWDDPRMPTIAGMRRRGYSPSAIRDFADRAGIAKRDNVVDIAMLEACVRNDLNQVATRRMVVLDPVKVVITNYPDDSSEKLIAENNPENPAAGTHEMTFSKEIYIERDDFMIDPPKKYFRLAPDAYVRLKHAYIIQCEGHDVDDHGQVTTIYCTYIPESKSGQDASGIKVKGTLHWVNAADAIDVEIRDYDRLFTVEDPLAQSTDFLDYINPDSLRIVRHAKGERALAKAKPDEHFQFLRKGYFIQDPDSTSEVAIFNLTVGLRDSWNKKTSSEASHG